MTTRLAKVDTPTAKHCLADFEHAVGYLQAGRDVMHGAKGPEVSERQKFLAANEGITNPTPMTVRMRRTMDQFDETMARIAADTDPYAGRHGDMRRAYRSKTTGELRVYRVGVPQSYETAKSVPLILMLHGGGGDENYFPEMDNGTIGRIADQRGYLIVCPRYHTQRDKEYKADLLQMIEVARGEYPKIDPKRIYVTGISMGGFATYTLATRHPDLFAAGCCVSGTGAVEAAEALKTTPMLIIQGGRDEVVPPAGAQRVDARLTELGYPHELHIFANNGHGYVAAPYMKLTLDWFDRYAGQ
jgi:predicted esterase